MSSSSKFCTHLSNSWTEKNIGFSVPSRLWVKARFLSMRSISAMTSFLVKPSKPGATTWLIRVGTSAWKLYGASLM
ncbi:hypothetical protein D3C78_1760540 [compost metagenome]